MARLNLFLIGYVLSTFDFGSVQGFVTDLCYGVILVLSLLLTVALPYLQRWLRYVSPLLVFVVLGLLFIGVALHATFDYTTLSPLGGPPANSSQPPAPATAEWIAAPPLEQVEAGRTSCARCSPRGFRSWPSLLLAVVGIAAHSDLAGGPTAD